MLAVSTLHREVSGSKPCLYELAVNHEFSSPETKARETNVTDMISYIETYDKPFSITPTTEHKLHNVISQEIMTDDIRKDVMNIEDTGSHLYADFRKQRFVDKSQRLSDTIHRNSVKTFKSIMPVKKITTRASGKHKKRRRPHKHIR